MYFLTQDYLYSINASEILFPLWNIKKTAEDYLKLLSKNYTICVLPNIYGERGRGVIDIFKASDKLYIRGNGEQTRTYVYAGDIAKGLVKAKDWENGGKYYFGGGDVLSINDLAKTLNKVPEYTEAIEGEIINSLVENTTPDWKPELKVKISKNMILIFLSISVLCLSLLSIIFIVEANNIIKRIDLLEEFFKNQSSIIKKQIEVNNSVNSCIDEIIKLINKKNEDNK